jgi:hypothetical protein
MGPPTRLVRMPETPAGASRRMPGTPGSLGPPSRKVVQPIDDDEDEEEELDLAPSTPVKREINPALVAEVSLSLRMVAPKLIRRPSEGGRL